MKRIHAFVLLCLIGFGLSNKQEVKANDFGTITFTNPWQVAISLEVKLGNNGNPDQNPTVVPNVSIPAGGSYQFSNGTTCFHYRRTASPGNPGSGMTAWTSSCASFDQNIPLN